MEGCWGPLGEHWGIGGVAGVKGVLGLAGSVSIHRPEGV